MRTIHVGLGSNIGNRMAQLKTAFSHLEKLPGSRIIKSSSVYETEPVGEKEQRKFLNAVVKLLSNLDPKILLSELLAIENKMGRKRTSKWGPRIIDLDILLVESMTINDSRLKVPHPQIANRRFVLIPLAEIDPGYQIEGLQKTPCQLLKETGDLSSVRLKSDPLTTTHIIEED
jgi:2-amino-4-hydroxy-6-hydroxymethyldihydropteridine diphosphokinase